MSDWYYQFLHGGRWYETLTPEKIPTGVSAIGVGRSSSEPILVLYPDAGTTPFIEETPEEFLIGWTDGPFSPVCHLRKKQRSGLWLSTQKNLHAPPSADWEPPLLGTWAAYTDGSADLVRSYGAIDRSKLHTFSVIDVQLRPAFTLMLTSGQRLIWRRRVWMTAGRSRREVHLCGFQQTIKGRNYQAMVYVPAEGFPFTFAGRFRRNHDLFDPVILKPEEENHARSR